MNIALWVIQALVGLAFLAAGFPKAFRPIEEVAKRMPWAGRSPVWFVRFVGVAEILGAIGLILPAATKILPWLTVAAAIGLVVVMVSAIIFHVARKEYSHLGLNVVLLLLAALIIVGRVAWVPIA
jgi:putative oxidoreductase